MAQKMFLPSFKWKILSGNKCQPFKFDNVTKKLGKSFLKFGTNSWKFTKKCCLCQKKKKKKKKKKEKKKKNKKYSDWLSLSFYMSVNPPSLVMKTEVLGQ